MKKCVLGLRDVCNHCGECDNRCQLDIEKVCDNCFKCLEPTQDFARIDIDAIYENVETDLDHEDEDAFTPDPPEA